MDVSMEGMPPRLRPLTLSDILDGVFKLYRNNFLTLFSIAAVVQLPFIVLQLLLTAVFGQSFTSSFTQLSQGLQGVGSPTDVLRNFQFGGIALYIAVSLILTLIQGLIIQQLMQGALARAVADRYLGQPVTVGGTYRTVLHHLGALVGAALLLGVVSFVVVSVAIGVLVVIALGGSAALGGSSVFGGDGDSGGRLAGLFLGLFAIFGMFVLLMIGLSAVLVRFSFFTQAVVLEGQGPAAALQRSWNLVGGSYWRVLGIILLVSILSALITGVPAAIANFFVQLLYPDPLKDLVIRQSLTSVVSYGAQVLVLPIQLAAYTLLYYDLRVRKEGYDMQLAAEQTAWQH